MVIGFILRIAYRQALDSVGVYAVMTLFILLSVGTDIQSPPCRDQPRLIFFIFFRLRSRVLSLQRTTWCSRDSHTRSTLNRPSSSKLRASSRSSYGPTWRLSSFKQLEEASARAPVVPISATRYAPPATIS